MQIFKILILILPVLNRYLILVDFLGVVFLVKNAVKNKPCHRPLFSFVLRSNVGGHLMQSTIRASVDTLYRDGANDVSRERIQTAPLAHPGRAS